MSPQPRLKLGPGGHAQIGSLVEKATGALVFKEWSPDQQLQYHGEVEKEVLRPFPHLLIGNSEGGPANLSNPLSGSETLRMENQGWVLG